VSAVNRKMYTRTSYLSYTQTGPLSPLCNFMHLPNGQCTKLTDDLTQTLLPAFPVAMLWIWHQAVFCNARLNPTFKHPNALHINHCSILGDRRNVCP